MKITKRSDAIAAGAIRYFTGKPCKRGHVSERLSSTGNCIACLAEYDAKRYADNPSARNAHVADWVRRNPERRREHNRRFKAKPEIMKLSAAYAAKRRANKLMAFCAFDEDLFELVESEAFDLAKRREKATGTKWHVDHVVPLQSKLVCGLHNEFNLAVIPAIKNHRKNNLYWPGMP